MGDGQNIARVQQDPRAKEFYSDPYRFYEKLRALGDFVYWEDYDLVMATTHAANSMVLRHPKMGRQKPDIETFQPPAHLKAFYALERWSLLELEPPDHTRIRRAATAGFGRSQISSRAPDISRVTDALIDQMPSGPFDLIEHFARPLPAIVITRFFGLPDEMADQLQLWSNDMVAMYQNRPSRETQDRAERASQEFTEYLNAEIDARGKAPRADMLSDMIMALADGRLKSRNEMISTIVLLLNAGHEASVHTLGHAVRHLAGHPERRLALEPTNITFTVEECLRFAPPLHMFQRIVYEDLTLMDVSFKAGQSIGCLLGSACRDDAVWPDGNRFDPFRTKRGHLAFGSGIHACFGAALARLELQIALPALFSRCPELTIVEEPVVADRYHFHGLERLMVDIKPARPSST